LQAISFIGVKNMPEDTKSDIEMHRAQSLPNLVRRHLEHMIFSGQILPGNKVNEVRIAKQLGISRSPVREACRQLEQRGFLTARVQSGSYVRQFNIDEIMAVFEVRCFLAEQVGLLAAERATEQEIINLENLFDEMHKANSSHNVTNIWDVGLEFHTLLVESTKNQCLADIYINLHAQHRLFRIDCLAKFPSLFELTHLNKEAIEGRAKIVKSIKQRDSQLASTLFGQYMAHSRDQSLHTYEAGMKLTHELETKESA
jgi:DNA-binding GntR family transcriptional regulator